MVLAGLEKVAAMANTIAIERDWVSQVVTGLFLAPILATSIAENRKVVVICGADDVRRRSEQDFPSTTTPAPDELKT